MHRLHLDYILAPISCEHCRSSRNNPHCAPRHVLYYNFSQQIFNDFVKQIPKVNDCDLSFNVSNKNRENSIKELLRLGHLNKEETQHIGNLIEKYADRFHIPGEPLGATTVSQHNIPTTDDQPIFSKQYRFPPVHKEEISRQVN